MKIEWQTRFSRVQRTGYLFGFVLISVNSDSGSRVLTFENCCLTYIQYHQPDSLVNDAINPAVGSSHEIVLLRRRGVYWIILLHKSTSSFMIG